MRRKLAQTDPEAPLTQEEVDTLLWHALRELTPEQGRKLSQLYREAAQKYPLTWEETYEASRGAGNMVSHERVQVGDKVMYLPPHAQGDTAHKDAERGVVTGKNEHYIFVRFGGDAVSKACKAEELH